MHDHTTETVGGRFVVAKQIQETNAKHGKVLGGVTRTSSAGIFAENDVQQPVALLFDSPVLTDGVGDGGASAGRLLRKKAVSVLDGKIHGVTVGTA